MSSDATFDVRAGDIPTEPDDAASGDVVASAASSSVDSGAPGVPTWATERAREWAATMEGHIADDGAFRRAHADSALVVAGLADSGPHDRRAREEWEDAELVPGATRARGAGTRAVPEDPDPFRTCFERDRDRILHSTAFRRLSGKTQVFVFPDDHQRTRLTHALEVAQVATGVTRALRLNTVLAEAIAIGHDCGHGPGGHASEDALAPFVPGGFDHAVWGADVTLVPLNLCTETLDGIRNHSWSRPAPSTPEAEVVSWADRIAYVCHDFEDAVSAGIVSPSQLPEIVRKRCGDGRREQLATFIQGMIAAGRRYGEIGLDGDLADALAAFREFNYSHIYLRPASQQQGQAVISVLRALVEHYADRPRLLPVHLVGDGIDPGSDAALECAVAYVGGMTDRYAFAKAVVEIGWDPQALPAGIDSFGLRR